MCLNVTYRCYKKKTSPREHEKDEGKKAKFGFQYVHTAPEKMRYNAYNVKCVQGKMRCKESSTAGGKEFGKSPFLSGVEWPNDN